ncbi:MAG: HlyC/CorC family transporter [Candidatus Omnitrophica bacterium]|nr:HlyC/CorC family transporter [Candidatus Omnitrophota bacterium]
MITIIELLLIIFFLFLAVLTAASETSIIAVNRLRLKRLAVSGSRAAQVVLKILEAPERFFSAILVINNVVDTLIATLMTVVVIKVVRHESVSVILATVLAAFLIIIFETSAKTLAVRNAEKMSMLVAKPVKALIRIFAPIVELISFLTNLVLRAVSGPAKPQRSLVSEDEIRMMIKMGEEEDVHLREKYRMLSRIFEFSETLVRSVMTPKKDMVSIDVDADLEEVVNKVLESGFSRLPVYKAGPSNIIGTINMKDILNVSVNKGLVVLQDIIYPPVFVSGDKKVSELLKEFQAGHTHLALVKGEGGAVEGLVTLEDLLEEIVGDINDEYDIRARQEKKKT